MKLQSNLKTDNIEIKPASESLLATLPANETDVSSVFVIKGITMGTAILLFNATTTAGKVISSPPVEIQVFDALKLDPTNITLIPTATYQIMSSGGPHHKTDIVYSVDKDYIASVDYSGLILAITPGHATVTGTAQSSEPSGGSVFIYSSDTVNVRVVRLRGVRIVIPSTTLVTGEELSVYVEGTGDGETPFSFASSVPGLTFYWSVSNMDVMSLLSVYDNAGISLENEKDFAARLRTRNPGWGSIKVTVKCPPGACIPDEASFTDEITVTVFAKLRLITPSDSHFLLPHNGHAKIITNRDGVSDISYELVQGCSLDEGEPVVRLLPSGDIFTAGFNGHAVVMVTAHETGIRLNQSIIVHVEVRPLHSLSLMSLSPAKAVLHSKKHSFPLGYSSRFVARLHDAVGRAFDYANIDLSYRLNRLDIVHVTRGVGNDTYIIKAARQGNAILKVWVKGSPHISDYIRVTVSYAIIPSLATVHLGAKICFTTHLTEDHPDSSWEAGGKGVIQFKDGTSVARAVGTGRAVVYHKVEGMVDTHTEISVATVKRVYINVSSSLPVFTNAHRLENLGHYLVPVEFKDEHNDSDFTLLQASTDKNCLSENQQVKDCVANERGSPGLLYLQQVSFDCILELRNEGNLLPTSNYIIARSYFDPLTGSSACQLLEAPGDAESSKSLSLMSGLSLSLRVKARDFDSSYEVWSESVSVPFQPSFSLDVTNVTLTSLQHSLPLSISGTPQVLQSIQVSCPHPFVLTRQSLTSTTLVYTVSLADTYNPPVTNVSDVVIQLTSTLTHQRTLLALFYVILSDIPEAVSCLVQNQSNATQLDMIQDLYKRWNLVFVVVATVVMFLVTIVVCIAIRQSSSSRLPTGFAAHLPPPVSSPQPSSPAFNSPQTTPTTKPNQFSTPLWSQSGAGAGGQSSAFKRTGGTRYPQHSPNRASPQYSMFSQ
ncbi:PREDICTED: nuclear pore membrane glycoprotein 210-like [Amphimedon queenslandica]|uniref:BIG2 domain-containing protein n=1 Tax=Amphimedon queenslandica TaxID=400682 RepID=A0A1X7V5H7_AMPQE|nr:PREDICTED: nuclear pore membrane glycoprotein 210-like [Amphimedon queenslandica]|eukprot:XP_019850460.1 PREDICTED: nuclear pore membrane glycoprotein 210-like [Amphimedon queenslandica]